MHRNAFLLAACLLAVAPLSALAAVGAPHDAQSVMHDADAVRKLQKSLTDHGYQVRATGKWDAATQAALRNFQEDNGLRATGKPTDKAVDKLGLRGDPEFAAFHDEGIEDRDLTPYQREKPAAPLPPAGSGKGDEGMTETAPQ